MAVHSPCSLFGSHTYLELSCVHHHLLSSSPCCYRPPMERSSSEISLGFPEPASESSLKEPPDPRLPGDVASQSHLVPLDVFAVAIICVEHQRIALQRQENKSYFLPFDQQRFDEVAIEKVLKEILKKTIGVLGKSLLPKLLEICRIELPRSGQYLSRYIFSVELEEHIKGCCTESETITWMSNQQIAASLQSHAMEKTPKSTTAKTTDLWGLECLQWTTTPKTIQLREIAAEETLDFLEGKDDVAILLNNLGCEKREVSLMLNEFIVHCYPAELMTFPSFCKFIAKIWPTRDRAQLVSVNIAMLFNAFDGAKRRALSFRDLILGLVIMDENILCWSQSNSKSMSKWLIGARFEYIFRYYDFNVDGVIDANELLAMFNDYAKELDELDQLPSSFKTEDDRRQTAENLLKEYSQTDASRPATLSLERLLEALQRGLMEKFRANSDADLYELQQVVFHLPIDIPRMASKFQYSRMTARSERVAFCSQDEFSYLTCRNCHARQFALSAHYIRLSTDGEIADIGQMVAIKPGHVPFVVDIPETDICLLANDMILKLLQVGKDLFKLPFVAGEANDTEPLDTTNWYYDSQEEKMDAMRQIIRTVQEIFAAEKRIVEVHSPCYVFGDLHGNLKDLLTYSHHFWRCAPFMSHSKYLFLGDYVDRGPKGIEVVLYLFCYKILVPYNFFLIRGNHEVRHTQEDFTFLKECCDNGSVELWQMINECFDRMPIGATIDSRIYAAHGGIPTTVNTIDQLQSVPCPLRHPELQSPEAWQILWNDPITAAQTSACPAFVRTDMKKMQGFIHNIKRGTAFLYGQEAVIKFCGRNQFDYIVRAHEVFDDGFQFFIQGRVLSVFSSSNYSGCRNGAAVLFIKQHRIRVLRLQREKAEEESDSIKTAKKM